MAARAFNVTLTSPNGGEIWTGASVQNITYTIAEGQPDYIVKLYYTTDNVSFAFIGYDNRSADGAYSCSWDVPIIDSSTVRVRINVTDNLSTEASDISTGAFEIDSTRPGTIHLEVIDDVAFHGSPTASSVMLSWTAPGDDSSIGSAASYDIRYNTEYIDEGIWDSSNQCSDVPIPGSIGSREMCQVTGLTNNTEYYFAIKAMDDASLVSELSNSPSIKTLEAVIWGPGGADEDISEDIVVSDTEIKLYGVLNIVNATLEFDRVMLRIYPPSDYNFMIEVAPTEQSASMFRVFDSNITSATGYKYFVRVSAEGTLMMLRSSIHDCGGALEDVPKGKDFGLDIYTNEFVMDGCLMTNSRKIHIHHSFPVSSPVIKDTRIIQNYAGIVLEPIEGVEPSANYINLINVTFEHCHIGVDCQSSVLGLDQCKFYNNTYGALYNNSPPDTLSGISGRIYLCIFENNTYALKSMNSTLNLIGVQVMNNTHLSWQNDEIIDEVYASIYCADSELVITRDGATGTNSYIMNNTRLDWENCDISDSTFATIYCKNTTINIDNVTISNNVVLTFKNTTIVDHIDALEMYDAVVATIYCSQTSSVNIADSTFAGNGRPFNVADANYTVNVTTVNRESQGTEHIVERLEIEHTYFTVSEGLAVSNISRTTFTNNGNGILAVASTLSISDCDIIDCEWGITAILSPLTVAHSNISDNVKLVEWANYPQGYGMLCALADAKITSNTFDANDLALGIEGAPNSPDYLNISGKSFLMFLRNVSYQLELWREINVTAGIHNNTFTNIVYDGIYAVYSTVTFTDNYIEGVSYMDSYELSWNLVAFWSTCTFINVTWHSGWVGVLYMDSTLDFMGCSLTRLDMAGILSYKLLLLMWYPGYTEEYDEASILTMTDTLIADSGYIVYEGNPIPLYFGAVACDNTTVTVANCTFTHNLPKGLLAWASNVTIRDCAISECTSAVELVSSTLDVMHVTFTDGLHGIVADHTEITVKYCTFDENGGTGIKATGCTGTIVANLIRNGGNGIYSVNSTLLITDNDISGNYNGISVNRGNPNITENHIKSNTGSGIICRYASPVITYNSITGNRYGFYIDRDSSPFIANNIIAYNTHFGIYCFGNSYPMIHHNLIFENNGVGVYISNCGSNRARIIASHFWENEIGVQIESSVVYIENGSLSKNDIGLMCHQATLDVYDVHLSYGTYGLYLDTSAGVNLTNVTVAHNAYGIYSVYSVLSLDNCTITDNIYNSECYAQSASGNATSPWNVRGEPDDSYATLSGNGEYVSATGYPVPPGPIDKVEIVCEWHTYHISDDYLWVRYTLDGGETYGNTTFADSTNYTQDITAYLDVTGDREWTYADISNLTIVCTYVANDSEDGNGSAEFHIDALWLRVTNPQGVIAVDSSVFLRNTTLDENAGDLVMLRSIIECTNTSFERANVNFADADSTLTTKWYLNVKVVDAANNPLRDATVRVRDNLNGTFDANYTTNADGWARWIECTEYMQNLTRAVHYTPHNISASKSGYAINYAHPEPTMNESKDVTIVVSAAALMPHAPIYIYGNENFTEANGVVSGSGTESAPYTIEGWDIDVSGAHGIHIENTDVYFIIRNCTIHDGRGNYHYGIYFYQVYNGTIANATSNNNYLGIRLYKSLNNTISTSTAYNNSYGILLWYSSNNYISACTVYNNDYDGIRLYESLNNTISASTVYNNYDGIILASSSHNNISACTVYNNLDLGVWLYRSSNNSISASTAYNNRYGICLAKSSNNEIRYCYIYNNTNYGIYNDNSEPQYEVNATYNWWGSADGPSDVGHGSGDAVSSNVLYDPWLVEPYHPPSIKIVQPEEGLLTNQDVTLVYMIDVPLTSTGEPVPVIIDGPSNGTIYTAEGIHNITITITDGAGNTAIATVSFTIDKTAPTITVLSPQNNTITNQAVVLTYMLSDNTDAPEQITANIANGTLYSDEDAYQLVVNATDRASNAATATVSFIIDKTAPAITVLSPQNNTITNQAVVLTYVLSDNMDAPEQIAVNIANGTLYSDEGYYSITINATDRAGNIDAMSVSFIIDKTAPILIITSPDDGLFTNQNVTVSYNVYDNVSSIEDITVIGDASPYTVEDAYNVTLIARDEADNNVTATVRFTIDKTPPELTSLQAVPQTQELYAYVNITASIPDNVATSNVSINITYPDGLSINVVMNRISSTNDYFYNTTYTIVGTYSYLLWANDTAANQNISAVHTFDIYVPNQPPNAVALHSPTTVTSRSIRLSWAQSTDADFARYEIYKSTTAGELGTLIHTKHINTATTYEVSGLTPGTTYCFTVRVVDTGGLVANSSQISATTLSISEKEHEEENDWLLYFVVIVAMAIIIVSAVGAIAVSKRRKPMRSPGMPPARPPSQQPLQLVLVRCHQCGMLMKVTAAMRPLTIPCPKCGAEGILR